MSETTHPGTTDAVTESVSPEQAAIEQELVDTVVASFDNTEDPRLKEVMQALTRHLHNFVREVRLTEEEWNTGIEFLTASGHITDDKRQEFILLSDVLGLSMQTIAINNQAYKGATEVTVFGPSSTPTTASPYGAAQRLDNVHTPKIAAPQPANRKTAPNSKACASS